MSSRCIYNYRWYLEYETSTMCVFSIRLVFLFVFVIHQQRSDLQCTRQKDICCVYTTYAERFMRFYFKTVMITPYQQFIVYWLEAAWFELATNSIQIVGFTELEQMVSAQDRRKLNHAIPSSCLLRCIDDVWDRNM